MKLVFGKVAAREMGVSPWYISSLKRAGAPFWGNKTSVAKIGEWLMANPGFVAKHQWPKAEPSVGNLTRRETPPDQTR